VPVLMSPIAVFMHLTAGLFSVETDGAIFNYHVMLRQQFELCLCRQEGNELTHSVLFRSVSILGRTF